MKNMRKLLVLVLAVMMVMSLAVNAFAASITVAGHENAQYKAYKLLNATNDGEKFAYTLNTKYETILKTITGKNTEADIIGYISNLDANGIRAFADAVYAAINADPEITEDYSIVGKEKKEVAQGYYLVAETQVGDSADTYSLVMLDTAGDADVTVQTKEDKPTVDKQVEEKNDSTGASGWGETADHDVTDKVNYKITGTVSSKYDNYKNYYYSFGDTMSEGLTYNKDAKVYVVNGGTKTEVTSQFTIDAENHSFTATANLKKLTGVTVNADSEIVVEYSCTLNEKAVIGVDGNPNTVVLEYENDPYRADEGEPENPGKTPEDTCIVFTYEVVVDKVHKTGENEDGTPVYGALPGAGFTLFKWVEVTPATETEAAKYDWVAVSKEISGVTTFEFERLDEGKYKLVETTVPEGYNKAEDVVFEIVSTLVDKNEAGIDAEALTGLKVLDKAGNEMTSFNVTVSAGKVDTDVVNLSGTELPSTGGIGTTIFYALGGILVLAAVVLLVTKKRMSV